MEDAGRLDLHMQSIEVMIKTSQIWIDSCVAEYQINGRYSELILVPTISRLKESSS